MVLDHTNTKAPRPDWLAREANNLNALRLFAALCVVVSHCALLRAGHESATPLAALTYFNLGDHALNVFFFISGLTVAASFARRRSTGDFVLARALRIWPALFVVVLATIFLVAPFVTDLPPRAFFADPAWPMMIAKTFVLSGPIGRLPGVFETNPLPYVVNGSPWTLRFEVMCYAALLAGSLTAERFMPWARTVWIPVTLVATGLVMIALPPGPVATTADHVMRFWLAFGFGAIVYQIRALFTHPAVPAVFAALAALAFVKAVGGRYECPAAVLLVGAATLFLARLPLGRIRSFANRFDLSYGIYITAWPITQIFVAKAPGLPFLVMLGLVTAISTGLAFLSWTMIEKPAIRLRYGRLPGLNLPRPEGAKAPS